MLTAPMPGDEAGVVPLLSALCGALTRDSGNAAPPALLRKMRARAYEVLLHRSPEQTPRASPASAVSALLACYFVRSQEARSVAERSAARDLNECIQAVREKRWCETVDGFESALRLLAQLKDEVPPDNSSHFLQPFTLGALESLLPRLPREEFSSALPYAHYPPHLFRFPHALDAPRPLRDTGTYTHYTVESFKSSSCLSRPSTVDGRRPRLFEVPSSLASSAPSGRSAVYSDAALLPSTPLSGPRDLVIPQSDYMKDTNPPSPELEEMFRANVGPTSPDMARRYHTVDIWELASTIDKNVPGDIWDIASKLPAAEERRLIAMSAREVALWRHVYSDRIGSWDVVSEKQFIRHVVYLTSARWCARIAAKLPAAEERRLIAMSAREVALWRHVYSDRISSWDVVSEKQFIRHVVYLTSARWCARIAAKLPAAEERRLIAMSARAVALWRHVYSDRISSWDVVSEKQFIRHVVYLTSARWCARIAAKLPATEERRLIAMSAREVALWRNVYSDRISSWDVVSEKQFIRHVVYLTSARWCARIAAKLSAAEERRLIAMSAREVALWRHVYSDRISSWDVVSEKQFIRHVVYLTSARWCARIAAKLPAAEERRLIAMSAREVALWRHVYSDRISSWDVVSEKQFIRHVVYLTSARWCARIAAKLPAAEERRLIAMSAREVALWRHVYSDRISSWDVVSEKQFIRHVVYLTSARWCARIAAKLPAAEERRLIAMSAREVALWRHVYSDRIGSWDVVSEKQFIRHVVYLTSARWCARIAAKLPAAEERRLIAMSAREVALWRHVYSDRIGSWDVVSEKQFIRHVVYLTSARWCARIAAKLPAAEERRLIAMSAREVALWRHVYSDRIGSWDVVSEKQFIRHVVYLTSARWCARIAAKLPAAEERRLIAMSAREVALWRHVYSDRIGSWDVVSEKQFIRHVVYLTSARWCARIAAKLPAAEERRLIAISAREVALWRHVYSDRIGSWDVVSEKQFIRHVVYLTSARWCARIAAKLPAAEERRLIAMSAREVALWRHVYSDRIGSWDVVSEKQFIRHVVYLTSARWCARIAAKLPAAEERRLIAMSAREVALWRHVYSDRIGSWDVVSEKQFIRHVVYLTSARWCARIAAKLPAAEERRLIAMSAREVALWRHVYSDRIGSWDVVSEKQFIRHIMYLTIGIASRSFTWSAARDSFAPRGGIALEGVSRESLLGYAAGLLSAGACYRRLYGFAFGEDGERDDGRGYIFEAAKNVVRRFLLSYRLKATEIFQECFKNDDAGEEFNCLPTLLQIMHHMEPLKYEIETVASIYKVIDAEVNARIPSGARLMTYLYSEISLVTHARSAANMFRALFSVCKVYFKFIERFIFQGELDDRHDEFFIRKDPQHVHSRSKRYWDRGFHIADAAAVPHFLQGLAKHILLCGKSFRLLKLCNPNDPLVLLISSDHPSVECCSGFGQIEQQRRLLELYRTRCRFVSGEPATFEQMVLRREAEKKAFTEAATVKQAETLEKIVAERKRLAQLIIAEKQHNLKVLEAAIAENKASKNRAKHRYTMRTELEQAADKAKDEADSILRDEEKNKMLEYYSKLNLEVEKRKAYTEWKIKRLQLDPERMQLLSTEERNLKREKLELEHVKNDDSSCSNSFHSAESTNAALNQNVDEVSSDVVMREIGDYKGGAVAPTERGATVPFCSSSVITVANKLACTENKDKLDSQGNYIVPSVVVYDALNSEFTNIRLEAKKNKQKVLSEQNVLDSENNITALTEIDKRGTGDTRAADDDLMQYLACNQAFIEAKRNRLKVLGSDNGNMTSQQLKDDVIFTDSQIQPSKTRLKLDTNELKSKSQSTEQLDNYNLNTASTEAMRNRLRALGTNNENARAFNRSHSIDYLTEAQKEALINKQKILGTEYHLEGQSSSRKPLNVAQEEAARNKKKVLASEYGTEISDSAKIDVNKRAALTLDLKVPPARTQEKILLGITPNTGGLTPGDFFSQLELETPTTAEVPFGGPPTAELLSPPNPSESIFNSSKRNNEYLSSDGFKFPSVMLEEDTAEGEVTTYDRNADIIEDSTSNTLLDLHLNKHFDCIKSSIWDLDHKSYNFECFDPFGVKGATLDSRNHLSCKMNMDMKKSCYTSPVDIIKEAQKKPHGDIFHCRSSEEEEPEDSVFENMNIATLTACFQRSIMLPLSYQLEVVNNSILTHYLIDLDMYEHLRSLRDYFFLMDGEFSKTICQNLFQNLVNTINPEELLNFATLHSILDKALGSSITNVNKLSESLSFTITDPPMSFQHSSPDVLQCLSLTYSVSWPLNIILSAEALTRYARLFQFLLKMRRISWMLGQDFEVLKLSVKLSRGDSRRLLDSPQYNTVQLRRHTMASLVRALDGYIVTTCIHSSWTEFEGDLKKARTLDDLYDCHVVYIKKVLFRCLLNKRSAPVMKMLNDIFTVILRFSHVLRSRPWTKKEASGPFTHPCFAQLDELFHLFEKLAQHLHKTVSRLMECGYQPHLSELLTMINLNGYYDPVVKSRDHSLLETTP